MRNLGHVAAGALAIVAAIAPVAEARTARPAPTVTIQSTDVPALARAGSVRVTLASPASGRVRLLAGSVHPSARAGLAELTSHRSVVFKRPGSVSALLPLTPSGRRLVASHLRRCKAVLLAVRGVYPGTNGRAVTRRATRLLRTPSCPSGVASVRPSSGIDDSSCLPSAAHPRPVILLHGLGARAGENWSYIAPRLRDSGYCVYTITYGQDPRNANLPYSPGGVIAMQQSSPQLAAFAERVLTATAASHFDIVGHSEGTVMPRWYLERLGGAAKVKRFVALTPLWRGTEVGGAALVRDIFAPTGFSDQAQNQVAQYCASCPQFLRGSAYLNELNADGEAVPGIEHTNIMTRYDELVVPYTSGEMKDGGKNIVLQDVCPADGSDHLAVAFDPPVAQMILNALDPPRAKPVVC